MAESEILLDEKEKRQALRRSESSYPIARTGQGSFEKRMRYGPESPAVVPVKRRTMGLLASDRPTEKLLNRIAGHIIHGHLQSIANELEISRGRYSQAVGESSSAKTQIYKVLLQSILLGKVSLQFSLNHIPKICQVNICCK